MIEFTKTERKAFARPYAVPGGKTAGRRFCGRRQRVRIMDIRVGDVLDMKKPHPCGNRSFLVLRAGMDFRLRCTKCLHEVMVPRVKAEKNIKKIIREE